MTTKPTPHTPGPKQEVASVYLHTNKQSIKLDGCLVNGDTVVCSVGCEAGRASMMVYFDHPVTNQYKVSFVLLNTLENDETQHLKLLDRSIRFAKTDKGKATPSGLPKTIQAKSPMVDEPPQLRDKNDTVLAWFPNDEDSSLDLATRIEKCYNACQGINPNAVPLMLQSLKDALPYIESCEEQSYESDGGTDDSALLAIDIRAALAKAQQATDP